MTLSNGVRSLLVAIAWLFAAALFAAPARAGSLQIRDDAHVLSSDDSARLRSVLASAPFDGRLVTTSEYADAQAFSRYVGGLMNEPSLVVVGVDPEHHHVQVHFGTGSRVARADWPSIERAGNDAFRRGDWEGGAAAIFRAASSAVAGAPAAGVLAPPEKKPSFLGPAVLLVIVAGVIGVAVLMARRRAGYGGPGGPGYGSVGGPGYGGGMPQQGGLGPLGGGLIGAGLGGLAGYELGKWEGEREERDRERPLEGGNQGADDGGNFDAGGGGSSWDDSGGGGGGDFGGGSDGGGSDF